MTCSENQTKESKVSLLFYSPFIAVTYLQEEGEEVLLGNAHTEFSSESIVDRPAEQLRYHGSQGFMAEFQCMWNE